MTPALTTADCVAAGGHHWVSNGGGILGDLAEHHQRCSACPAGRVGYIHTYRRDAQMRWTEPYNRIDGPWPWRELTPEEYAEAAKDLEG